MTDNDNKAMEASLDQFTDHDMKMLKDFQIREKKREHEIMAEVKDGTIVRTHERREIYSFNAPGIGDILFDVRGIKDAIIAGRMKAAMFRLDVIPEHYYEHVLKNGGVELDRVEKIMGTDLERPGIMVIWGDGHSTLIDGNHRLVRRYQLGNKTFRFIMVGVDECIHYMCRPGEEERFFPTERLPGYVETLHKEIKVDEKDD